MRVRRASVSMSARLSAATSCPLSAPAQPREEVRERISAASVGVGCLGCGVGVASKPISVAVTVMVRSPGKVIVSTGALVSSQPAARMASAASICVMPPTSVPQTETFGKMASFFATSTMPTAPAAMMTASTMSAARRAILPPRPRGFFSFARGASCAGRSCRDTGWRCAVCFGAAARRPPLHSVPSGIEALRCAERSCAAKSAASRFAAALRLEVLPLSFMILAPVCPRQNRII